MAQKSTQLLSSLRETLLLSSYAEADVFNAAAFLNNRPQHFWQLLTCFSTFIFTKRLWSTAMASRPHTRRVVLTT